MFLLGPTGWRGLAPSNLVWDFKSHIGGVYQPFSWLTYGVDYALWGLDARGYHVQSAVWHALSAGLFFFLARRVLGAAVPRRETEADWTLDASALTAALVFGLHPLRVESVSWASERRDVVCGALFIASVLAYLRAREPGRAPLGLRAPLLLFLSALLAKGMAVTLPAVLLILDVWPLRRLGRRAVGGREVFGEKLPFFAFAAFFALVGTAVQHRLRWTWEQHGLAGRFAQSAYSFAFYAARTLWPAGLLPMYELRPPLNPFEPRFLAAAVVAVVAAWACVRVRRERPWAAAALAAYGVMLAPVCGLFQFGPQIVADRYSYLACLPLALVAGAVARWALPRRPVAAGAAAAAVLLALATATVDQQACWSDSKALWTRVLAGDPDSGLARAGLGRVAVGEGRLEEAERSFRRALAAFPGCAEDQDRLAAVLSGAAATPEQERRLRASVETRPLCRSARASLGAVLAQRGDLAGAERVLKIVTAVAPDHEGARMNLARVEKLLRQGRQPR